MSLDEPIEKEPEQGESNEELFERFQFTVDKGQEAYRIDKFLMSKLQGATRNKLQRAINTGLVLVNNQEVKQNYKVKALDRIIIYSDLSPESTDVVPEKMELPIIYKRKIL